MNNINKILENLLKDYPKLENCSDSIYKSFQLLCDTYSNHGKLMCCGNGGSSADCDHIVGELMKGFMNKRALPEEDKKRIEGIFPGASYHLQRSLPAINLSSQTALFTAYINDCEPSMVYAQLVYGYAQKQDTLLCISTSGNSPNIVYAAMVAKAIGIKVIGLTGSTGGKIKPYCDVCITVSEEITHLIQEMHLPIYHCLCAMMEEWLIQQ